MRKKEPSKFNRLRKRVRALKEDGHSREMRAFLVKARQHLEEFLEREGIRETPTRNLVLGLSNSDKYIRAQSAKFLGESTHPRFAPVLVKALEDPTFDVRMAAVESMGKFKDERFVQPLIDRFKLELDQREIRREAAVALVRQGDKKAAPALIKALKEDKSELVRGQSAVSLGLLKDKRATQPLIDALKDEEVWRYAVVGLGNLGDKRAVPALLPLLQRVDALDQGNLSVMKALGKLSFSLVSGQDRQRLENARDILGGLYSKSKESLVLYFLASHPKELRRCPVDGKDVRGRNYVLALKSNLKDRNLADVLVDLGFWTAERGERK